MIRCVQFQDTKSQLCIPEGPPRWDVLAALGAILHLKAQALLDALTTETMQALQVEQMLTIFDSDCTTPGLVDKDCTWLTICVLWRIPRQMGQVNSAFNFRVESVCVLGPVTCDTNLILHKSCLA